MAHKHSVYDSDPHFSINADTRLITNKSTTKTKIIQYDHNSERFTFEIPRYIDGHDMSLCDKIAVHYINVSADKKHQNAGVYECDDMQLSPESDDVVIFSWLISQNATRYAGTLNFLIRFTCSTAGEVDYVWNTGVFSGVSISNGINNGEAVVEEYSDVLEAWKNRLDSRIIQSLVQTVKSDEDEGVNVWAVVFGDGSVSTLEVKNGSKGMTGSSGIKVTEYPLTIGDTIASGGDADNGYYYGGNFSGFDLSKVDHSKIVQIKLVTIDESTPAVVVMRGGDVWFKSRIAGPTNELTFDIRLSGGDLVFSSKDIELSFLQYLYDDLKANGASIVLYELYDVQDQFITAEKTLNLIDEAVTKVLGGSY